MRYFLLFTGAKRINARLSVLFSVADFGAYAHIVESIDQRFAAAIVQREQLIENRADLFAADIDLVHQVKGQIAVHPAENIIGAYIEIIGGAADKIRVRIPLAGLVIGYTAGGKM